MDVCDDSPATITHRWAPGDGRLTWASWRAVGGTGDPADASPAEQDMRALMLYQRAGFAPWGGGCR